MQSIGLTIPIFIFIVIATVQSVAMLLMGQLFGPSRNTAVKEMPYESGMDPIHDTRRRFDVRFHLVAIAFLVFDVELLFIYPWAVVPAATGDEPDRGRRRTQNMVGDRGVVFGEVMVFIVLLGVGFVYAWRKGVFRWR